MSEAPSGKIKIGLLLSKINQLMSKAEAIESCKIYFKLISSESINNLLILEIEKKQNPQHPKAQTIIYLLNTWLNRLALTKEAYIVIGTATNNSQKFILCKDFSKSGQFVQELTNNVQEPKFKISIRNIALSDEEENKKKISEFAKELSNLGFYKTDMRQPHIEFTILNSIKPLAGLKLWTNNNSFEKRKAHLRPILHPTAINPKLARAMINIAGAEKEILDPFCGTGGILLEAALIGINAAGIDISKEMIARAKINIDNEEAKRNIRLNVADALNWTNETECVITDLPYGKSSKLKQPLETLLRNFLLHYSLLTKKMTICFPDNTKYSLPPNWIRLYNFKIYIHKSLTRNIIVIKRKDAVKEEHS